ncbi:tandem-95 repeat protein [Mycolicibacterium flavescens]|nr:Ig-like domain-containing protein [Mycolicibacterium flavescens]MCV7279281.1 tandem-95 repeat protein [Mycolicibacterium flavescens]
MIAQPNRSVGTAGRRQRRRLRGDAGRPGELIRVGHVGTGGAGYGRYVGRVGALAVALGVGLAVATTGPSIGLGTAHAEDGESDTSQNTPDTTPNNEEPTHVEPPAAGGDGPGQPGGDPGDNGAPEMKVSVSGGAQLSGQPEEGEEQNEGGEQEPPATDETPATTTPAPEVTATPPPADPPVQAAPPQTKTVARQSAPTVKPQTFAPVLSTQSLAPAGADKNAGALAGGITQGGQLATFSLTNDSEQELQSLVTTSAPGTPSPAPVVRQPSNPIEALIGAPVALVNIAVTAVTSFFSGILAPGPDTPAPPMMLFAVLGWVQRELQRTFFNQNPTAVADAITTSEDTDVDITVLDNDIDADRPAGDVLTVTDYTQPTNGSVVLNDDGTFTYTPNENFTGEDSFSYTVSDEASPWHLHGLGGFFGGGGHSSTTTVTVTVGAVNDAPEALDDNFTTNEDTAVEGALPDGIDVDGDSLTYEITRPPEHGTITAFDPVTGSYTYVPDADDLAEGETREDSFDYVVNDGDVDSNTATVSIVITGVNDAPVAADDEFTVDEDSTLTFTLDDLLENDSDAEDDPLTPFVNTVLTPPSHGTLTVVGNTFTYVPDAQSLDDGEEVTDTFTYLVTDGNTGMSSVATVSITVTGVNDAPEALDDSFTTDEDTPVDGVLPPGTDVDGDELTYTIIDGPINGVITDFDPATGAYTYTPLHGTVVGADGGTITLDDPAQVTQGTASGPAAYWGAFYGPHTYVATTFVPASTRTYEFSQPEIPIDTVLHVYQGEFDPSDPGANRIAYDDDSGGDLRPRLSVPLTAGQQYTIVISNYYAPADLGLPLTVYTDGPGVFQAVNADALDDGEELTDSFTYVVNDGDVDSAPATVSITITGVNDAPEAADASFTTDEDAAVNGVLPPGTDVDGETLTYEIVDQPGSGTITNFNPATGSYTYTPDAQDLGAGETRTDSFTYVVNDGDVDSAQATVSITITGVNDAPVAVGEGPFDTTQGSSLPLSVADLLANDTDADGDTLTITGASAANGTVTGVGTGTLTYTPNATFSGVDTLTYTVSDGNGGSDTATVSVNVASTNTILNVGDSPTDMVVIGNRLYVTNYNSGTVTVVDIDTNTMIDTDPNTSGVQAITVGTHPIKLRLVGNRLYVSNYGDGSVSVIDTTANTLIDTDPILAGVQSIDTGSSAGHLALYLNKLFVTNALDNTVWVIDTNTNTVIDANPAIAGVQPISVGQDGPFAAFVSGNLLVVANHYDNTLVQIRTVSLELHDIDPAPGVQATIDDLSLSGARGIAFAVVNTHLHVYTANANGTVTVVDFANNYAEVDADSSTPGVQPINVGGGLLANMVISGNRLYVANYGYNRVEVIDITTNTVVDTIAVGDEPWGVLVDNNRLFVANRGDGTVTVVDITPPNAV